MTCITLILMAEQNLATEVFGQTQLGESPSLDLMLKQGNLWFVSSDIKKASK